MRSALQGVPRNEALVLKIIRTISEMRAASPGCGFVPTMGAFHEGHRSLMRRARAENDTVVVSLFVNPTQFGVGEDFERYPRNEAEDVRIAEEEGVDILFVPTTEEMYRDRDTTVDVGPISLLWEGAHRPGHFTGVATVVCKLFNIVQPACAYFGKKDLQQLAVIKKMVSGLYLPIKVVECETVREKDGLAMSSRNQFLSPEDRVTARAIYRELSRCARARPITDQQLSESAKVLRDEGFNVDYFALVDTDTMQPVKTAAKNASIIAAARLGKTRLIDNVQLSDF